MASEEEPTYVPKDAIRESLKSTMILGAAGSLLAAAQNTLARKNYGPWGMFTRFGSTIVIFGSPCRNDLNVTLRDDVDNMQLRRVQVSNSQESLLPTFGKRMIVGTQP